MFTRGDRRAPAGHNAHRDQTVNFLNQDHRLIDSHGYKS
jgi:hypothetical protein